LAAAPKNIFAAAFFSSFLGSSFLTLLAPKKSSFPVFFAGAAVVCWGFLSAGTLAPPLLEPAVDLASALAVAAAVVSFVAFAGAGGALVLMGLLWMLGATILPTV
jgi:hypothetical protein